MNNDPRIESYLTSLEKVLRPFPVSDRAEIITEIKSHILSALERDPRANLDSVLSALGEPETVANRYLLERQMKPAKPPISPILKWLVIGFLGTLALFLIFVGFVISQVAPKVQVDGKNERVSVMDGFVEIDGKKGTVSINGQVVGGSNQHDGSQPLSPGQSVHVKFNSGKVEVVTGTTAELRWHCRSASETPLAAVVEGDKVVFDSTSAAHVKCEISVPEKTITAVEGKNGKIEIDQPRFGVAASLANGKVEFSPDQSQQYRYEVEVSNGNKDEFKSSDSPEAHLISIRVANGRVHNESEE